MQTKKNWEYLITISGGGGHLSAIRALEQSRKKEDIPVKTLDLMRSSASFGRTIGTFFTNIWDNAQKKGDIAKLKRLVKKEYIVDILMYLTTIYAITKDLMSEDTLPRKIRITHPICLPAIFSAMEIVNFLKKKSPHKIEGIDLYMTDFPTDTSEHFYSSLRRMSYLKRWSHRIVLHSPPLSKKIDNEKAFWQKMTSIPDLVVIEEDIPIHQDFYKKDLPSPHTACSVKLLSQTPRESAFHHSLTKKNPHLFTLSRHERQLTIQIKKEDKVGLIMLGSQPTHQAITDYLEQILKIQNPLSSPLKNNIFLFIACGSSEHHSNALLNKILDTVCLSSLDPKLHIVPFSKQTVFDIFGRADLTVTRSGGLTTAELLAILGREKEQATKRVIIHTEKLTEAQEEKRPKHFNKMQWRNYINNPLWERGNAEYLAEKFPMSIAIAGPDTIAADFRYYLFSKRDIKPLQEAKKTLSF